jgi:acetylornithine deacetylase/succinyl-diaminopimelate desuccinylase-like protein
VLPGVTAEQFLAEVRAVVGPDPEIEVTNEGPLGPEPVLDLFFELLSSVIEELERGAVPVPTILSGATDARHFAPLGITGYGYLPLNLPAGYGRNTVHNADERVPAAALEFGTCALTAVLDRYRD